MKRTKASQFVISVIAALVVLSISGSVAVAQPSAHSNQGGDIVGIVEQCGVPSSRVKVHIPGESIVAQTNSSGAFRLLYVQPGSHSVSIEKGGQILAVLTDVVVSKNKISDLGTLSYCVDADNDGFDQSQDCDDQNPNANPGAQEVCDGIDNDCDGVIDEGCQICSDADSDGFFAQEGCGTAADCDDSSANINPNAVEVCDGVDNDCDGSIDEEIGGGASCGIGQCQGTLQCTNGSFECAFVQQPSAEICGDSVDNDCDGQVDEGCCPSGLSECNQQCVDLANDSQNCGTCGATCLLGTACFAGSCVAL